MAGGTDVATPPAARPLSRSADAQELARTPVANPYRGQLADPFIDQAPPEDVALYAPRDGVRAAIARPATVLPPPIMRRRAPSLIVAFGVGEIVLGAGVGILGLLVIALVNVLHDIGTSDRSFYAGSDASYLLMGFLDFAVAALLIAGAIGVLTGRMSGRIACTVGNWAVLGFSIFWWGQGPVPLLVPGSLLVASAGALLLSYQRAVSTWLGVASPPQPE